MVAELVARDSSGNGNDGVYHVYDPDPNRPVFVTGCVAGDLACELGYQYHRCTVQAQVAPMQWLSEWSVEIWLRSTGLDFDSPLYGNVCFEEGAPEPLPVYFPGNHGNVHIGLLPQIQLEGAPYPSYWRVAESVPSDMAPHHLVVTYANPQENSPAIEFLEADVTFYLDGVALALTNTGHQFMPVGLHTTTTIGGIGFSPDLSCVVDEFAAYSHALSAGSVAAHYAAASVSFPAYTAAVLADAPDIYYHLNDGGSGWHLGRIGMGA